MRVGLFLAHEQPAGCHVQSTGQTVDRIEIDTSSVVVLNLAELDHAHARRLGDVDLCEFAGFPQLFHPEHQHSRQDRTATRHTPSRAPQPEPEVVLTVLQPMVGPIRARVGDALVLWPGHETHALTVFAPDNRIRAHRACADAEMLPAVMRLLSDGVVTPLSHISLLAFCQYAIATLTERYQ